MEEAERQLALQKSPELIALNSTQYLITSNPLTPIKRSILKIRTDFEGNAKGTNYGTGFVIKREGDTVWLLTNRHVVIDNETGQTGNNLEVEPYYGEDDNLPPKIPRERSAAKIIKTTPNKDPVDLAVLEVKGLPADIQPLSLYLENIGTNVAILIRWTPRQ